MGCIPKNAIDFIWMLYSGKNTDLQIRAMVHSPTEIAEDLRPFPDHTQLPESDGTFVKNFPEHPQSILLTDSIEPVLKELHPDGQYAIAQDSDIY